MNETITPDRSTPDRAAPARRVHRMAPEAVAQPAPQPSVRPARKSAIAWRALVATLCDLVIGGGGAALLWFGGNATIADAPLLNYIVFVLAITVLLVFRHLATGRRGLAAATLGEVRVDQIVTLSDLVILSGVCAAWIATGNYLLGWLAVFSGIALLLGTALQLMLDLLSGRNADAQEREGSLFGSRILALEICRIALGIVALAVIIVGAGIHEWNPNILNLTVILVALPMGISTLVTAARNRR